MPSPSAASSREGAGDPIGIGAALKALHGVPALIAYIDKAERYVFANEAYRHWLDLPPEDLQGRSVSAVAGADVYPKLKPFVVRALAGRSVTYEQEVVKDGRPCIFHGSYTPHFGDDGAIEGFFVHVTDVTERRRSEAALSESEARFASAFEHAAVGLAVLDRGGRFLEANPALCRMVGYDAAGLRGRDLQDITDPGDRAAHLDIEDSMIDDLSRRDGFEKRFVHGDGRVFHAIQTLSLARDRMRRPRHVVAQLQVRSGREAVDARLLRAAEFAESALWSIGHAVVAAGVDGSVTIMNAAAEELTGWRAATATGRPFDDVAPLLSVDDGALVTSPMEDVLRSGLVVGPGRSVCLRRRDGTAVAVDHSIAPVRDRSGAVLGGVAVFRVATEHRSTIEDLLERMRRDPLTGLPNRVAFRERLHRAVELGLRSGDRGALLLIDLDRFGAVNQEAGQAGGDAALVEVGRRLRAASKGDDLVCRWGNDEFAVLLSSVGDPGSVTSAARRLVAAATGDGVPSEGLGDLIAVGASIGVSIFPQDGGTGDDVIAAADAALEAAKRAGSGLELFRPEMRSIARERVAMEATLRQALRTGSFKLRYQPRIDLATGVVVGAEALVRLLRDGAAIPPSRFIGVAEQAGMICALGDWVLEEACRQMAAWRGSELGRLRVSVNVSAAQVVRHGFDRLVLGALGRHAVDPCTLEVELTEGILVEADPELTVNLTSLRRAGVTVSLDDFGTGYSSLGYLRRLPVDVLKVDRTFVQDIELGGAAIVKAVVDLSRAFGKRVVAEGIETPLQLARLKGLGCDEGQGYLFAPPLDPDDLPRALTERGLSLRKRPKLRALMGSLARRASAR